MLTKKRFNQLKNKNVYSAIYINIEDPCYHKIVYVISDSIENTKKLLNQIDFDNYELLNKSIEYLCKFKDLDETEQVLFENKDIHFFDPEKCN